MTPTPQNNDLRIPGNGGQFAKFKRTEALGSNLATRAPEPTVRSRRLLVEVVELLRPFEGALTVVGAHAVMHHASRLGYVPDSTADADAVMNPSLVAQTPNILEVMGSAGLELTSPDRPGIYGYAGDGDVPQRQRTTIDLIVPEMYAGAGRRAARVPGQKGTMTRASGLELALFDHEWATIETLPDDKAPLSVKVRVAGAGALLVAKAHKVRDRFEALDANPHRLRPKDSRDIALLMLSSDPLEVAQAIKKIAREHPETEAVSEEGFCFLSSMYHSRSLDGLVREHAVAELHGGVDVQARLDAWIEQFNE
ncbi:hypothetical protein ACXR2T_01355 [Leucobacter sp. HY1910]